MRKMKKVLSLAMTAAMTASLLTGMGAVTASAKKSDDGKRTKITALLNSTESTEQYQVYDYLLKNFCDEKGIDYEIEMVNDKSCFTDSVLYSGSYLFCSDLPDFYKVIISNSNRYCESGIIIHRSISETDGVDFQSSDFTVCNSFCRSI